MCEIVEVDKFVAEVRAAFSQIDVLINNAGGCVGHSPIVDASADDTNAVFRLNARSVGSAAFGGDVRFN